MNYTERQLAIIRNRLGENVPVPSAPRKRDNEESRAQQAFVEWFDAVARKKFGVDPRLLYAVPNAARRSAALGAILKREGLRAGAPDLLLDVARGKWHGARIEMKKDDGVVSDEQRAFHRLLIEQGYAVRVCYSVRSAIEFVAEYLNQ